MPAIPAGSWVGLVILAQQILIGVLLGFTLRLAFAAIDLAGDLIGLQMGLSFAVFYDPQNAAQTPVLSEFLGLLATLIFLAMNGHLLALSVLAESFKLLPVSATPIAAGGFTALLAWTATLFSAGVLLSLPLIAALLIANIAHGRAGPRRPATQSLRRRLSRHLMAGFVVLMVSLPYFGAALERLFDQSFSALHTVMRAAGSYSGGLPGQTDHAFRGTLRAEHGGFQAFAVLEHLVTIAVVETHQLLGPAMEQGPRLAGATGVESLHLQREVHVVVAQRRFLDVPVGRQRIEHEIGDTEIEAPTDDLLQRRCCTRVTA